MEDRTRLVWSTNGLKGPFRAEVIPDGGDFARPTISRKGEKDQVVLPQLDPDTVYHWRVVHIASGVTSNVMTFRTAPYAVRY